LSGSGVSDQPSISISPSSHDFGSSGGSQTFDVTNNGNTSLSNVSVGISGTDDTEFQFSSTGSTGPIDKGSLSVGQTKQVTIDYNPSTASTDDASLNASGDGSGQTATDSASLSGDGLVAGFVQSITAPSDIDVEKNNTNSGNAGTVFFGGETSVSYTVTVSDGSNTTATVVSGGNGTVHFKCQF
jgi:hypothetical protein